MSRQTRPQQTGGYLLTVKSVDLGTQVPMCSRQISIRQNDKEMVAGESDVKLEASRAAKNRNLCSISLCGVGRESGVVIKVTWSDECWNYKGKVLQWNNKACTVGTAISAMLEPQYVHCWTCHGVHC